MKVICSLVIEMTCGERLHLGLSSISRLFGMIPVVREPPSIYEKIRQAPDDVNLWSLEFFPPKTVLGQANLCERIERMTKSLQPSWVHVTWGTGGSTRDSSLELAARVQNGVFDPEEDVSLVTAPREGACDVCLHLTCTNVDPIYLDDALDRAKRFGIRNILALRGDAPRGEEYWVATDQRFQHAIDLIRYIRARHGDYFCIGMAGFPESLSRGTEADQKRELAFLKEKQDAGAQFIVTQLFYDVDVFVRWYHACRQAGITIPVIPGIMPIQNYSSFLRSVNLCGATVPQHVLDLLEPIRMDDAKVKDMGIELSQGLIRSLRAQTDIHTFHIYTLNLEKSATNVIKGVSDVPSPIPDMPGAETWDEFPNGRYTDARSPAFGEMDGYGASLKLPPTQAVKLWGTPVDEEDISRMFTRYVSGQLPCVPWCDIPVWDETTQLLPMLLRLNMPKAEGGKSWWTVGSQPAVDGCDSSDPVFGFGPQGGYIFQKAFVELFLTQEDKEALVAAIRASERPVTYFAGTCDPASMETNVQKHGLNTVTWGVFPGKEVAQSTIIEEASFRAWRDEAFAIWREWELLFPPRSATRSLLRSIHDQRWLVTVVHHDYKDPSGLWNLLDQVATAP